MGFPSGMVLNTIAFGIPLTATGKDVVTKVTVKPTSRVIWAATGQPLPEFSDSFTAEAGQLGQFQVPAVDQAGFIDSAGNAVTDFAYQVSASWEFGNERPITWSKNLKPLQAQSGIIDLDLVPDGPVSIPVTAPNAAVLGFGGRTGFVTLQESDLPSRLSAVELSATFAPRTLRRSHYPAVHCGAFIGIGTTTSYVCRRAFQLPHKAERFRVHVRNFNFLTDTAATGNLSAFQLLIGAHKVTGAGLTGEFVSSPAQLAGGVTLAGGAEWVSGWVAPETYMIDAHEHFLLSYAFTAPAGSQIANGAAAQWAYGVLGGVPAGLVSALLAPGPLASSQSFLDVWIEYETLTAQPTVLVVGNSHTDPGNVGGRAIRGEFTGWPHKVMVMTGAPVANLAISAAGLANYVNDSPKWTYLNPADYTPDIVVLADLPSSDLVSGVAVATVKTQFAEVVDRIHALWPKARILATTNFPRGDQAGGTEALNREWADYLMDCPAGLEQVTDPAPAMRAPEKSRRGLTPSRIALTKGTTATSGGTFAAGTYYWTVTAMNANGETAPAMEVTATLQANGTQALSWSSATGSPELLRYRLYRGTTASSYTTWVQDFLPGTTSYVDSGSSLSGEGGGLAPSWYNTTPDVAKLAPELVAGTDDVHFNERGHSVIAGTIAQMITGKAQ